MSDHFNTTLERKLETSGDESEPGVGGVRRIELITGVERRRRWSNDDKARIVVESFVPGANVSEVARRHGLSPQQLFAWRREARVLFDESGIGSPAAPAASPKPPRKAAQRLSKMAGTETPAFVPVVVTAPPPGPPSAPAQSGTIEIAIGDIIVRVVGQVDPAALAAVLRVVRRAA